jgi:hypothetical protein
MSMTLLGIAGPGLLFFLMFLAGFWLKRTGKPYNTFFLTVHKLTGLAAAVLFVMIVLQVNRAGTLSVSGLIAGVVTVVFFLDALVTGGIISINKPMPEMFLTMHRIFPYLTLGSAAVALYLIFRGP